MKGKIYLLLLGGVVLFNGVAKSESSLKEGEIQLEGGIIAEPVVDQKFLYVGTETGNFYAVDLEKKTISWKFTAEGGIYSACLVEEDKIYFTCHDQKFYILNKLTGEVEWTYHTGSTDISSPVFQDEKVYFGLGYPHGEIICLDVRKRKSLWKYKTHQPVYSSPALVGKTLFCGSNDSYLYSLDAKSGKLKWKYKTKGGVHFASPITGKKAVFFAPGHFDKHVYAFDGSTGQVLWKFKIPVSEKIPGIAISALRLKNNTLYFQAGFNQATVYALDTSTGRMKWKSTLGKMTREISLPPPAVSEKYIVAVTNHGKLVFLTLEKGSKILEEQLNALISSSPLTVGNYIYLGTHSGAIYLLKEKKGDFSIPLPKKTLLAQNYPNPFNPETYLPYQISQANKKIKIKIYNILGQLVRKVDISYSLPGDYLTPSKSFYWDGKDNQGRELSSGVYFSALEIDEEIITFKKTILLK